MEAYVDINLELGILKTKSLRGGNKPLSGVFNCVFSREILAIKVVYRWMNMFKLVMYSFC